MLSIEQTFIQCESGIKLKWSIIKKIIIRLQTRKNMYFIDRSNMYLKISLYYDELLTCGRYWEFYIKINVKLFKLYLASSTKDVWPKFRFQNKKGLWKKISIMSDASMNQ